MCREARTRALLVVSALGCALASWPLGCAGGAGPLPGGAEADPFAREADPLPTRDIASPDGALRARVPAREVTFEETSDALAARFDIGADAPALCVFALPEEPATPAHLLMGFLAMAIQTIPVEADAAPPALVESRARAGVLDRTEFLSLDAVVQIGEGVVELKQRTATRAGRTIHCSHPGPGYHRTFDGLFFGLLETLESDVAPPPPPLLDLVFTAHVDGQPSGTQRTWLVRDEATGVVRTERRGTLLLPVREAPGTLVPIDWGERERARDDGTLLEQAVWRTAGFADAMDLTLSRAGPDQWQVEGSREGEPFTTRFRSRPLVSLLTELRTLGAAARSGRVGEPLRFPQWIPHADAGGASELVVAIERNIAGAIVVEERLAGDPEDDAFVFALDERGLPDSGTTRLGPHHVELRRELAAGALPPAPAPP